MVAIVFIIFHFSQSLGIRIYFKSKCPAKAYLFCVCAFFPVHVWIKKNYIDLNLAFIVWKVISRWGCQAQRVTLRHAERSVLMLKLI